MFWKRLNGLWLHWCNVEEERKILERLEDSVDDNKKNCRNQYLGEPFEKELSEIDDYEEYLEEMARKERLEQGPLRDHGLTIPDFYKKYR